MRIQLQADRQKESGRKKEGCDRIKVHKDTININGVHGKTLNVREHFDDK